MARSTVVHLKEIEEGTDGTMRWRPVRHHLGILGFGVSAWTGRAAGDRVIKEHGEPHDELYLVHQGRASFEVDGERLDAPAGTLVFVRPGVTRTAFADEPGTTIIAMGGMPGQAFEPDGWEIWSPLRPLYVAGDYEGVVERARAVIEAHPEYAEPMFNLACCESLLGRPRSRSSSAASAARRRGSSRWRARCRGRSSRASRRCTRRRAGSGP